VATGVASFTPPPGVLRAAAGDFSPGGMLTSGDETSDRDDGVKKCRILDEPSSIMLCCHPEPLWRASAGWDTERTEGCERGSRAQAGVLW
jgi:hypothetical protein